jgi:Rod binding domain-containing protein
MNALEPTTPPLTPTPASGLGAGPVRPGAPRGAGSDKLREVAQDFESIFIFQMLDTMYSGLATDGPFGGGPGEKMFRSLMHEEIAKSISSHGGFGIGEAVYRELLQLQEMQNGNGPV